jgi:hypothetical protein
MELYWEREDEVVREMLKPRLWEAGQGSVLESWVDVPWGWGR